MISWIPVDKDLPKQKDRIDDDGNPYKSSDMVLVWTDYKPFPIGIGCYEDNMWFVDGVVPKEYKVQYWAYINGPDGRLLKKEYQ